MGHLVCPCGQVVEQSCAWPPYQTATFDSMGNVLFAICIHGCVVVDKRTPMCCDKEMKRVDDWWVCTKCWKHFKNENS